MNHTVECSIHDPPYINPGLLLHFPTNPQLCSTTLDMAYQQLQHTFSCSLTEYVSIYCADVAVLPLHHHTLKDHENNIIAYLHGHLLTFSELELLFPIFRNFQNIMNKITTNIGLWAARGEIRDPELTAIYEFLFVESDNRFNFFQDAKDKEDKFKADWEKKQEEDELCAAIESLNLELNPPVPLIRACTLGRGKRPETIYPRSVDFLRPAHAKWEDELWADSGVNQPAPQHQAQQTFPPPPGRQQPGQHSQAWLKQHEHNERAKAIRHAKRAAKARRAERDAEAKAREAAGTG